MCGSVGEQRMVYIHTFTVSHFTMMYSIARSNCNMYMDYPRAAQRGYCLYK